MSRSFIKGNIIMKMTLFITILIFVFNLNLLSIYENYEIEIFNNIPSNVLTKLMNISCIDENNCISLRTDNNGTGLMLEKTTDGGNSWTLIYADTSFKSSDSIYYPKYYGVECKYFSDGTIVILTDYGKIIRSEDYGETFTEYPQIKNYFFSSFVMFDSLNAITTSTEWNDLPDAEYQILKSTDGCISWSNFNVPDTIVELWDFYELSLQKDGSVFVYIHAKYGFESDSTKNYFYHTDFEGNFWKYLEVPKFVNKIYMFDEIEGYATGKIQIPGSLNDTAISSKTYDGGQTWVIKSKTTWPYELFSSQLVHNDNNIFISGSGFGFLKSTDKGESWFEPNLQIIDKSIFLTPLLTTVQAYFDSNILYFFTHIRPQVLKATKVISSVSSPSVKPKKIYPNPVSYGSDFIAEYEIATSGHLNMYLSDLSGREVCPLYSDFAESGSYSTSLRLPENISSGSYWLVSEQNGYKHVQLLNVVK
jgi:hypothetical protein